MDLSILIVFVIYLLFMLAIGGIFFRKTESTSDYFLGDRKLNKWVAALSAQASDMSGWLLLGLPGAAYLTGLSSGWIAIGLIIGTYLNWKFVAKRLRKYTETTSNALTLSEYFARRFRDPTKLLEVVSALFILVFFLIYTASGFVAGAKLFSTVFEMSYLTALIVGVVVIVSYTFLGGFNAVCWTDFFQGSLMFMAILAVPVVALFVLGGPGEAATTLNDVDPKLFSVFPENKAGTAFSLLLGLVSSMAWGLGYFGQPHILARFMAIRSAEDVKPARRIAMVWVVLALAGAIAIGLLGRGLIDPVLSKADSETVFMVMVGQLFPPLLAGVLLAAILAAIMSTADSQLLVTTSAITEDFYKTLIRKNASDTELVWVSRLCVVGVALFACCFALNPEHSVLELVAYAWAGFGAAFGPTIIFSLYWKRMTWQGALGGIIAGGLTVLGWQHLQGGIFDIYEIVPGFLLSSIAIVVLSLISKAPAQEITDEFNNVASQD